MIESIEQSSSAASSQFPVLRSHKRKLQEPADSKTLSVATLSLENLPLKKAKKQDEKPLTEKHFFSEMPPLTDQTYPSEYSTLESYRSFQEELVKTVAKSHQTPVYPTDDLMKAQLERVYIRVFKNPQTGRFERGLHAKEFIARNGFIATYDGAVIDRDTYAKRNPIVDKDRVVLLKNHRSWTLIKSDDPKERLVSVRDNPETRGINVDNVEGVLVNDGPDGALIKLFGHREARHTLQLSDDLYIDSDVKVTRQTSERSQLEKGKSYIMGLGALINSADPLFDEESKLKNNAQYVLCKATNEVAIVAILPIEKDEEVFVSYNPGKIRVIKTKESFDALVQRSLEL